MGGSYRLRRKKPGRGTGTATFASVASNTMVTLTFCFDRYVAILQLCDELQGIVSLKLGITDSIADFPPPTTITFPWTFCAALA